MPTQAIVTDIEGTTTSIAFVHDVLFPYARARIAEFVGEHAQDPEVRAQLDEVERLENRSLGLDEVGAVLERWIDEDRKATPLKTLQGLIWRRGYADGSLKGHLYPDVPRKLRTWHQAGIRLYVYSSGSVEAQKLIYGHTDYGDLTPLFSGYFDTRVGGKREAASYTKILEAIGLTGEAVLFLSDVGEELDAARTAGLQTCQLLRDTTARPAAGHRQVHDFDALPI